jgi:phosphate transport system ATP-binding protein
MSEPGVDRRHGEESRDPPVMETRGLSVHYGERTVVRDITLTIPANRVVAFIGPSGSGKSAFLRCFNRMNDLIAGARVEGQVLFHGLDISRADDVADLRRRVGMVFQKPNPFPKSIRENVAFGLRVNGYEGDVEARVVESLQAAGLWEEVRDRMHEDALGLSAGQQQRLCIARALAVGPEVLLLDEPVSALDPIAAGRIEDLVAELKRDYTIVTVTHNMQQAARISDLTAFLYMGELVEYDDTEKIFTNPSEDRTEQYITGRIG